MSRGVGMSHHGSCLTERAVEKEKKTTESPPHHPPTHPPTRTMLTRRGEGGEEEEVKRSRARMTWQGEKGLLLNRAPVVGGGGMGVGVIYLPGSCGGRGGRCPPSPSPGVASPRIEFAIPPPPPPPHPPYPGIEFISGEKGTPHLCPMGGGGGEMSFTPLLHLTPGASFFFRTSTRCPTPPPPPSPDRACFGSGGVQPPVTYARHRVHRCIDRVGIILFPWATQPPRRRDVSAPSPMETPSPPVNRGGRGFSPSPPPPLPPPPPPPSRPLGPSARGCSARGHRPPPYPTPGSSLFFGDGGVDPGSPGASLFFRGMKKYTPGRRRYPLPVATGESGVSLPEPGGRNHPSTPIPIPRPP